MKKTAIWLALLMASVAAFSVEAAPELRKPGDVPGFELISEPVQRFYAAMADGDFARAREIALELVKFVEAHPELAGQLQAAYDAARALHPGLPPSGDIAGTAQGAADSIYRDSYHETSSGQNRELTATEQRALDAATGDWFDARSRGDARRMGHLELQLAGYAAYFPEVEAAGRTRVQNMAQYPSAGRNQFVQNLSRTRGRFYDMRSTMKEALALYDSGDVEAAKARVEQGLADFEQSGQYAGRGVDWAKFTLDVMNEDCEKQTGGGTVAADPAKDPNYTEEYGGGFTSALSFNLDAKTVRYAYAASDSSARHPGRQATAEEMATYYQERGQRLAASNSGWKAKVEEIDDCERRKREAIDHGRMVGSPIVLDLNRNDRADLYDRDVKPDDEFLPIGTVFFDLDGDGAPEQVEWMLPGQDGLLCIDLDGDGAITSGHELFGTAGGFADGYLKLSQRDADGDGALTGAELEGLLVWIDNGDGYSASEELHDVRAMGFTSISVRSDDLTSSAVRNGEQVRTWDWFTESRVSPRTASAVNHWSQ